MRLILLSIIITSFLNADNLRYAFSNMKGWSVAGTVTIVETYDSLNGKDTMFHGCDTNTIVKFDNGLTGLCTSINLALELMPTAVIFRYDTTYQGKQITLYKMLVKDYVYDLLPN
jgi:hypothetical protein